MIYLLDVNSLVALGFQQHEFHRQVAAWVQKEQASQLATCSITELGFVQVLSQAPAYGFTVVQAQTLLLRLKAAAAPRFTFLGDSHDISHLPVWVKSGRQVTDGHLAELAKANATVLATLDGRIPGVFLIPHN